MPPTQTEPKIVEREPEPAAAAPVAAALTDDDVADVPSVGYDPPVVAVPAAGPCSANCY